MIIASLIALVGTVLFAAVAPQAIRALPPAAAIRLLIPASLVVTATGIWVFLWAGFTWLAQLGPVSRYGEWSADQIRETTPFPTAVAVGCGLLAIGMLARAGIVGTRRVRVMLAVRDSCRPLGAPRSLVVLDTERPDAFATPGGAGRIVVTTGLLRALSAPERRALLAHEAAHIAHRHAWWLLAAQLAAAANPMLRPTTRAVEHALERWADEDAAREVRDRRLVARTLARTALLTLGNGRTSPVLPAAGGDVPGRVRALLDPPPRPRFLPLLVLVGLLTAVTVATVTVQRSGDELLDRAGNAPAVAHR